MRSILFLYILITPYVALGQAYNCDGVWGNQPCKNGTPLATLQYTPPPAKSEAELFAAQKKSKKQSLVHDLNMKASDADRKFKIHYDLSPVVDFCNLPDTAVLDCQTKINELGDKIDAKVHDQEVLETSKKANQLQEEKNKIDSEKTGASTTIIREPIYVVVETPTPIYGIPPLYGNPPRRTPYAIVKTPVYGSPFSDQIAADKKGQHDFSPDFGRIKRKDRR